MTLTTIFLSCLCFWFCVKACLDESSVDRRVGKTSPVAKIAGLPLARPPDHHVWLLPRLTMDDHDPDHHLFILSLLLVLRQSMLRRGSFCWPRWRNLSGRENRGPTPRSSA